MRFAELWRTLKFSKCDFPNLGDQKPSKSLLQHCNSSHRVPICSQLFNSQVFLGFQLLPEAAGPSNTWDDIFPGSGEFFRDVASTDDTIIMIKI
jgi:hypothetical protein